ncbi:hypothetical protein B0H66DRAFT_40214 [Apodospora peruviana]|uniref:Uncharacterized protein n=1 Tax=Apodospora peruviana TaxID=516989 RepID=A0AAE0IRZ4_9PEZI|nr:hypothetical protein B0H66DRAFT_40214 [Apodospora peruviana]
MLWSFLGSERSKAKQKSPRIEWLKDIFKDSLGLMVEKKASGFSGVGIDNDIHSYFLAMVFYNLLASTCKLLGVFCPVFAVFYSCFCLLFVVSYPRCFALHCSTESVFFVVVSSTCMLCISANIEDGGAGLALPGLIVVPTMEPYSKMRGIPDEEESDDKAEISE